MHSAARKCWIPRGTIREAIRLALRSCHATELPPVDSHCSSASQLLLTLFGDHNRGLKSFLFRRCQWLGHPNGRSVHLPLFGFSSVHNPKHRRGPDSLGLSSSSSHVSFNLIISNLHVQSVLPRCKRQHRLVFPSFCPVRGNNVTQLDWKRDRYTLLQRYKINLYMLGEIGA